jgi:ribosomal protein S28E/S33
MLWVISCVLRIIHGAKKKRTDTRAVCDGLKVGACLRMEEQVRDRVAGEVSVQ